MREPRRRFESTTSVSETDLLLPPNPQAVPQDRLNFVYIIFYLLGIGTLLPWNFFSNAKDYFMFKLRNTTSTADYDDPDNQTELQLTFESYLSVAAMLPGVLFMFLNTVATKLVSLRIRMMTSGIVMIIMFGVTIALVKIDTDGWQLNFFAVTLVTIVIMNAGSAVLQGGMFGLSGMFPPRYTQAVMGGMGMGGTLAAVANILAITISRTPLDQGFGYFFTALSVIILALIGYLTLPLLKFARFHTKKTKDEFPVDGEPITESVDTDHMNYSTSPQPFSSGTVTEGTGDPTVNHQEQDSLIESADSEIVIRGPRPHLSLWSIFTKIWLYAVSVFLTFTVTLSCYPAVASAIKSSDTSKSAWATTYFSPVMCFVVFNVGDLFGRTSAGFLQFPREGSLLLPLLVVLRIGMVPLFLFCNVQPRSLPVPFMHDAWPICIMAVFAVSNGHLGTIAMMYGPRRLPIEDVETGGAMMSFFLSLGLGVGSLFSFVLVKLV